MQWIGSCLLNRVACAGRLHAGVSVLGVVPVVRLGRGLGRQKDGIAAYSRSMLIYFLLSFVCLLAACGDPSVSLTGDTGGTPSTGGTGGDPSSRMELRDFSDFTSFRYSFLGSRGVGVGARNRLNYRLVDLFRAAGAHEV